MSNQTDQNLAGVTSAARKPWQVPMIEDTVISRTAKSADSSESNDAFIKGGS